MSAIVIACVYALWLAAGSLDFHFHRRTDLPHTSAMRESLLHGVQLLLIGSGVLAWLLLENTLSLVALLAGLVIAHAVAGYLDTVSADGRRRISPAEQHVHSVLDAAPWVLLAWVGWQAHPRWSLEVKPAAPDVWWLALLPALGLVVLPWLWELRQCVRAREQRPQTGP
ncbi:TPA: hypothetical protein UM521_002026 [Stenotrophomonas maltophilia]|uniref:hypothetical protein n=1 Tax=Stenotrophomonas maltophilia TaxID=40324 RepID=UPI0011B8D4AB|nr:hypothetical protein [Stenotrophomonas maltophilia]EKT4444648.1 hypothetical protein [Stenotrophomonas maltophilia]MBH1606069.1 hypothetical protein [Stenotrophomonas maltophilia]UKJ27728.1 hypothetical protein L6173_10555 [Stenotrophomonas maltophilia]GFF05946.1 hypothetical protein SM139_1093 [Stenotrophomonas maltophilia]HDS1635699.1 hypothetical protein [Stenotrophomonas maltophilia]